MSFSMPTAKSCRGRTAGIAAAALGALALLAGDLAAAEIIPSARRIAWDPGVRGGIPARATICANVRNAPYSARGDGAADDTGAIQRAIDACGSGQVVYVPAGTYRITAPVRVRSDVTLRGDGIGKTIVRGASGYGSRWLIGFEDPAYDWALTASPSRDLVAGISKGSDTITTSVAHGWSVGDVVLIDQLEDPSGDPPITNDGGSGACTWCGRSSGNRPIGQWARITAVTSSTTARIEPALYWNYKASATPQAVKATGLTTNAGIEDLTVDNSTSGARDTVYMHFAVNSWLLRVELVGSYRRHVDMYGGLWNTIKESILHDGVPASPTTGAQYGPDRAYGVFMGPWPTACLVEDNIFYGLTLMVSLEGAPSGNVIAYNFFTDSRYNDSEWGRQTVGTHGAHPMMNLIESNHAEDKFSADFYWGTSSHQTYFRNRMFNATGKLYGSWGFDLYRFQRYYNIVGNVLGTTYEKTYEVVGDFPYMGTNAIYKLGYVDGGDADAAGNDALVKSTLLRHGNWDSVNGATLWDPAIADRTLPASLYLTAKPAWFGSLAWPAIGPDLAPMTGKIPAEVRFQQSKVAPPMPPTGLTVTR